MKRIWTMDGSFLYWELSITVRPSYDPPRKITEPMQSDALVRMKRVAQHFEDAVNLHEFALEFDSIEDRGFGLRQHGEPLGEKSR